MLFLADVMLKKLARWLRIVGAPTIYAGDYTEDDDEIIKLAMARKAVLLTLDKKMFEKARDYVPAVFFPTTRLEKQLSKLIKQYSIPVEDFPSRTICPQCNSALRQVPRERVKGKVFPKLYKLHKKFWACTNKRCGKIYWEGSHWEKIEKTVARVIEGTGKTHDAG